LDNPVISVVSPVYKAELILDELVKRINESIDPITSSYEIILVEDHSPDGSWEKIVEICQNHPEVKGIKLSRNFGQHNAIAAGLFHAHGEYIIVMDCDLQDNPKYIKDLLEKAKEGNEIVYTLKIRRKHNKLKNAVTFFWSKIFNWLADDKALNSNLKVGSYSLITKKVLIEYNRLNDYYKPYLGMLSLLGFKNDYIKIEHEARFSGKSSYSARKLISHAVNGIISQTDKLLTISIFTGLFFSLIGIFLIVYLVYLHFYSGFSQGWASLVVLIIFNTGLILTSLGIVGAYIGKIFLQTKNRPNFIVEVKINI